MLAARTRRKAVPGIDRPGSVFPKHPSHGRCAPAFKLSRSQTSIPHRFRARIQADRVSIMERPHSSESGWHHPAAPSFKQSSSRPDARPHSMDLTRLLARPQSSQSRRPQSSLPGLHTTGNALNQAIRPLRLMPPGYSRAPRPHSSRSGRTHQRPHSSRSGLRSPLRSSLSQSESVAQNLPSIISDK